VGLVLVDWSNMDRVSSISGHVRRIFGSNHKFVKKFGARKEVYRVKKSREDSPVRWIPRQKSGMNEAQTRHGNSGIAASHYYR
jgi:hypothetical protein